MAQVYVGLSRQAFLDLEEIEAFSTERWGEDVARDYLQKVEDALTLIRENPKLLRSKAKLPKHLCFYRVERHFLVCAVFESAVFILTVKHGAIDLPVRLERLEPHLNEEAKLLYRAYLKQEEP